MLAVRTVRSAQRLLSRTRNVSVSRLVRGYYSRNASTSSYHPLVRELAGELSSQQPSFYFEPQEIRILGEPSDFLDTLLV